MNESAPDSQNAFTNVDAQDFAFELRLRGSQTIDQVLDQKGRSSDAHTKRVIAAAETAAAANGHPPAETGWCAFIEEWLLESEFMPDQTTVVECAARIEKTLGSRPTSK